MTDHIAGRRRTDSDGPVEEALFCRVPEFLSIPCEPHAVATTRKLHFTLTRHTGGSSSLPMAVLDPLTRHGNIARSLGTWVRRTLELAGHEHSCRHICFTRRPSGYI
jgi:hypothetical protein